MDPVAVLEALEAVGYTPDALEAVGRRIIFAEVVGVDDLVAAGLSGGSVVAVRRALDPSVSEQTHGCVCWVGPGEVESEVHGGVRAQRSVPCPALLCSVVCCGHIDVCRGLLLCVMARISTASGEEVVCGCGSGSGEETTG